MSNALSIRDKNSFISAYQNLLNDNDKLIHKKDVNTLYKILNKCDKVEVSQLLRQKMEFCPKDPAALKDTFSKLFAKLEAQPSGMHPQNKVKLHKIQAKLTPVIQDIHNKEINAQKHALHNEARAISSTLSSHQPVIDEQKNIIKDV